MSSYGGYNHNYDGGGGGRGGRGGGPKRKGSFRGGSHHGEQGQPRYGGRGGGGVRQDSYNNSYNNNTNDDGYNNQYSNNNQYNNNNNRRGQYNDNTNNNDYGGSGRHGGGGGRGNRQYYGDTSDSNRSSQRGMYKQKKKSLRGGKSQHSYKSNDSSSKQSGGSGSANAKPIVVSKALPTSSLQRALQQNSSHSETNNTTITPRLDRSKVNSKQQRNQEKLEQRQQQQHQQQQQQRPRERSSSRREKNRTRSSSNARPQEESTHTKYESEDDDDDDDDDDSTTSMADEESIIQQNTETSRIGLYLNECNWVGFFQELERIMGENQLSQVFAKSHEHSKSTLFHTTIWKAPPRVVRLILDLMSQPPTEHVVGELCMKGDQNRNTPLHLACANLTTNDDMDKNLTIISFLADCAPKAVDMQNEQGDTPLALLVSSPAVCTSSLSNSNEEEKDSNEINEDQLDIIYSVISQLMDASKKDICKVLDSTGATVLHTAIGNEANESVLLELLRSPSARNLASIPDERGMLPLHYVAAKPQCMSPKFVKELIQVYPEALTQVSIHGDTPLHILISNSTQSIGTQELSRNVCQIIDALMGTSASSNANGMQSASSSPFTMLNQDHLSPLHCCAFLDVPSSITKYLMKDPKHRKYSSLENNFGATPLHLAVAQPEVETSIANVIALGTREAASTTDRLLRTPLHVAAQNPHATGQLMKVLTDLYEDACGLKTQRGHLPLHLACQSQAKEEVVKALVRAYPKATEARNKSNNTPLHDAAKYKASAEVVQLLLDTYLDAVYIQNQYGNLPLHCATGYEAPDTAVQLILNAWPDGASMQNKNQDAPLHYAAAYCSTVEAVKPIIDAAPAAVLLLNSTGESPIDRAKANNPHTEVVQLLEASAEEWAKKASTDGWASFRGGIHAGDDDAQFGATAV